MSEIERLREALDDLLPYAIHAQAATWKAGNDWSMKFSIAIERCRALASSDPAPRDRVMTEEQVKHMVGRFLCWRLPANFNPDAGISFKPMFNEHTAYPMKHEPTGTNLFAYDQADAMVRHMLADPAPAHPVEPGEVERLRAVLEKIAESHDAGRHDGLPEPCPAHDAYTMWLAAQDALSSTPTSPKPSVGEQ